MNKVNCTKCDSNGCSHCNNRGYFIESPEQGHPPVAGPVWVKLIDKFPENLEEKQVRVIGDKVPLDLSKFERLSDGFRHIKSKGQVHFRALEWLNIPAQQLFTREDMERAYNEGDLHQIYPLTFDEYMNTNYPHVECGNCKCISVDQCVNKPQSFTRTQVEMAFYAACNMINYILKDNAIPVEKIAQLKKEYMETNYLSLT